MVDPENGVGKWGRSENKTIRAPKGSESFDSPKGSESFDYY
jgi:hypothetical protein